MRKNVLVFGLIAGVVSISWLLYLPFIGSESHFENGELIGYGTMLIAFSMIIVAVKNFRDKQNGGVITFGKALRMGLGISLIASTVYVGAWLIYYYASDTTLIKDYIASMIDEMKASGASEAAIRKTTNEMNDFARMYQNPFFNALMTYMEILPVGLFVSLAAALILKRKPKQPVIQ